MSLDTVLGAIASDGEELELGAGLNFTGGLVATPNPDTGFIDVSGEGGGGGGGHIIQTEGVDLASRPALDFVGPNVSVANTTGASVVTIPIINLADATKVTGQLPVANIAAGFVKVDGTAAMTADLNLNTHKAVGMSAGSASTDGANKGQLDAVAASALLKDGSVGLTADWNAGAHNITASPAPTTGNHLANKSYVDTVAAGLSPRSHVKALSVANVVALTGAQTLDGVACAAGERVLLTAQTVASQNGAWIVQTGAWTRPTDFATGSSADASYFFVEQGTVYADTGWVCTTNEGSAVVDTNNLAFVQFSAAGVIVADETTLHKVGNTLSILNGGVGTAQLAANAVTYAKMQATGAASVALGRGSASGAGAVQEITFGVGVRMNATQVEFSAALAPLATLGTALQQIRVNAGASALEYFSPPSPVDGGNLTNANVTKNISDGSLFTLPASTLGSTSKTITLGTSGTPEDQEIIEIIVYSQAFDFIVKDGGAIGDSFYTVVAGTKRVVHAQWSAAAASWRPAGKIRLA